MCLCVSVEREGASQKQSHKPIYLLNKVNAALKVTKMLLIFAIVTFTNYYWSQNSFVFTVWVSKFCNKGVGVCDIHWLELKGDDLFKSHNGCSCHQHHSLQLLKSRWQIVTTIIDNLKFAYLEISNSCTGLSISYLSQVLLISPGKKAVLFHFFCSFISSVISVYTPHRSLGSIYQYLIL